MTAPWFFDRDRPMPLGPVFLCEIHKMRSIHLMYFFFLKALRRNFGEFRLVGFTSRGTNKETLDEISATQLRNLGPFKGVWAYRAMGMRSYFPAEKLTYETLREAELAAESFYKSPSHRRLEKLRINNVIIGDLIYDEYLRTRQVPTVDLDSRDFREFFLQSLTLVFNWFAFFSHQRVIGVISTDVYLQSVPARIAHSHNIDSFVVDSTSTFTYRLSKMRPRTRDQYRDYPNLFQSLSPTAKKMALNKADVSIKKRTLRGEADPLVNNESAWTDSRIGRQIKELDGLNILVAAHDFSDSPHSAFHFYPDFHIWLETLGRFAQQSRHNWYVKTHRDASAGTISAVNELVKRFPCLKLIDRNTSHKQLIEEGVSLALTVLGTIGIEYASQGLPVLNATRQHTHMGYSFNLNPKSRAEYESLLRGLEGVNQVSHPIQERQVLEYIFMHRFYNRKSLIYSWPYITEGLFRHSVYLVLTPQFVKNTLINVFSRFIQSKKYWMDLEDSALVTNEEWELLTKFQIKAVRPG